MTQGLATPVIAGAAADPAGSTGTDRWLSSGPPMPVQLDLAFEAVGGRSVIARRHVAYPFNVTAPLQSAVPRAEVIVQSASGGLYGGERLCQRVHVGTGAHAVLKMPSATVVHATRTGDAARQGVSLRAEAGATLLYLPRPLILFPGGALAQAMDITVAGGATVMVRDGFLLHDPSGAAAAPRTLHGRLTVRAASGDLVAMDAMRVDGGMIAAGSPGVTGAYRAFGAVWLVRPMPAAACRQVKAMIAERFAGDSDCYVSTTALRRDAGAVVRVAASDGGALDMALEAITGTLAQTLRHDPSPGHVPPGQAGPRA